MENLRRFWSTLRRSFWFVPSLIVAFSIGLAVACISFDESGPGEWMARWPHLFGAGAAGARGMLSTIAGSMMTVVGVTFSMTLVTLSLASSQYTSRILRNFMGDRITQVVLGIFAGIFSYCLIVLRTIRGGDEGFIPSLAVSLAVVLAIGGIGVLILFIHHIASSIQASNIIATVAGETLEALDRHFPESREPGPVDDAVEQGSLPLVRGEWRAIPAPRNGYIQSVSREMLLRLAAERDTAVRMERGVGAFIIRGTPLVSVALAEPATEATHTAFQSAFGIGRHRTVEQDVSYGIRQIVDMALHALSPGVNDTTTAVMCVDYLSAILGRLAPRPIPSLYHRVDGVLRVIAIGPTFNTLVAESFEEIRGSASGNLAIMLRMVGALETVASLTTSPRRRRVLQETVEGIAELAERTIASPQDRARFERCLTQARDAI